MSTNIMSHWLTSSSNLVSNRHSLKFSWHLNRGRSEGLSTTSELVYSDKDDWRFPFLVQHFYQYFCQFQRENTSPNNVSDFLLKVKTHRKDEEGAFLLRKRSISQASLFGHYSWKHLFYNNNLHDNIFYSCKEIKDTTVWICFYNNLTWR